MRHVAPYLYAQLEPDVIAATFGNRPDAAKLAAELHRTRRTQVSAIRRAYETWRRFEARVAGPGRRAPVGWVTEEWVTGDERWIADDPSLATVKTPNGKFTVARCGAPRTKMTSHRNRQTTGTSRCIRRAGERTSHYGVGRCWRHGGNLAWADRQGAWIMAHAFARELDVSPWDALLKAVRIAAGKVAYTEHVLSQAADDRELEGRTLRSADGVLQDPDTGEPLGVGNYRDRSWWVEKNELWTDRLARYAKAAIDAGVAERLVEAQVLQVRLLARPVEAALAALQLDPEREALARAAMRRELLAIESENVGVLEGQLVDPDGRPDPGTVSM